ncbi:response regulator [Neptunomonas qingdaonensis]|uniref:Two-component system, chemotaxis family, response regulator CheY n=1 Tax=Neptunomonas qingdaonensis TaxID=1045558 RepID=A0A1I2SWG3_9GAMM|nr:response regulator [Neptunomonas qingdaonensis]SFG54271.1 two-component system, chemotaxis family, response regulator CheY [Neptunomonas qingdaonensis]
MNFSELFVLIIEPSRVQKTIIINQLKSFGIENIDDYSDGGTALNAIHLHIPDIVLSSMHLPDMTGTDVVNEMRQDPNLMDVTFFLVSSETHYRYLEPIRQAGAIAILPKPFSRQDLGIALQSTLHYLHDLDTPNENSAELFENVKILLVDDSQVSRKYLHQLLDNLGIHAVTEASDGAEAIEILKQESFDLIVSDYNMPNIDGREMLEYIRSHGEQPTIPFIMVTCEQNRTQLAAIKNAGVSALCCKPLSYDIFKNVITQLVLNHDVT